MANILSVDMQNTIKSLRDQGWSQRRISRELGIHRKTVSRYLNAPNETSSKCTISIPGGGPSNEGPNDEGTRSIGSGRRSDCEPFRSEILSGLEQGLSVQRIYQDLVSEHQFESSYQSVQRFIQKLEQRRALPFRRLECEPGEEVQVDFGSAAPIVDSDGKRKRPHLFRVILSHSRKGYSEVVSRQTTDHFIRALENAFRSFGGVPRKVIIDNLKAAVIKADFYDPEIHPKVRSFCRHYGTVMLPTKPRTPRHKGKVERGVGYVKNNALKGRVFSSLADQNGYLKKWEQTVADTRIHGTTQQQVKETFAKEKDHLLALPPTLFPTFEEGRRSVHRDQHVEVCSSYYSVPSEYVRREVWVRYTTRTVKIFSDHWKLLATHVRVGRGKRSTNLLHIPNEKISGIERGEMWQLRKAGKIGPHAKLWAEAMLKIRGIEGVRVLQGLISLPRKYYPKQVDEACQRALALESFHLRDLKKFIDQSLFQQTFDFLDEHPLIRDLDNYSTFVPEVFQNTVSKKGDRS